MSVKLPSMPPLFAAEVVPGLRAVRVDVHGILEPQVVEVTSAFRFTSELGFHALARDVKTSEPVIIHTWQMHSAHSHIAQAEEFVFYRLEDVRMVNLRPTFQGFVDVSQGEKGTYEDWFTANGDLRGGSNRSFGFDARRCGNPVTRGALADRLYNVAFTLLETADHILMEPAAREGRRDTIDERHGLGLGFYVSEAKQVKERLSACVEALHGLAPLAGHAQFAISRVARELREIDSQTLVNVDRANEFMDSPAGFEGRQVAASCVSIAESLKDVAFDLGQGAQMSSGRPGPFVVEL